MLPRPQGRQTAPPARQPDIFRISGTAARRMGLSRRGHCPEPNPRPAQAHGYKEGYQHKSYHHRHRRYIAPCFLRHQHSGRAMQDRCQKPHRHHDQQPRHKRDGDAPYDIATSKSQGGKNTPFLNDSFTVFSCTSVSILLLLSRHYIYKFTFV